MEAVGEFEKVWSWADSNPSPQDVPLTRELSPEFHHRSDSRGTPKGSSGHHHKALSPVDQRRARGRSPTSHHPQSKSRGQSSPAELRKVFTRPSERQQSRGDGGFSPTRRGFLPHGVPHQQRRRALSPDIIRRNSSRGGGLDDGGPVRILRREKTSVFDNRYPSLDLRSEKRKSLYEMQDDGHRPDLRRRSYHELNNPELLHPPALNPPLPRNFPHSGKKSGGKEPSISSNGSGSHGGSKAKQMHHPGVIAAMPPPPHWNPHLHPHPHPHPAEMVPHPHHHRGGGGPFYPHPAMVGPHPGMPGHPMGHMHGGPMHPGAGMMQGPPGGPGGRFGIAPLRQY